MEKAYELVNLAYLDEQTYGSSYVEFGERSMEVLDPTKIEVIHTKKEVKDKVYGKSVIAPINTTVGTKQENGKIN